MLRVLRRRTPLPRLSPDLPGAFFGQIGQGIGQCMISSR